MRLKDNGEHIFISRDEILRLETNDIPNDFALEWAGSMRHTLPDVKRFNAIVTYERDSLDRLVAVYVELLGEEQDPQEEQTALKTPDVLERHRDYQSYTDNIILFPQHRAKRVA